jgi:hypothetical protein
MWCSDDGDPARLAPAGFGGAWADLAFRRAGLLDLVACFSSSSPCRGGQAQLGRDLGQGALASVFMLACSTRRELTDTGELGRLWRRSGVDLVRTSSNVGTSSRRSR